MLKARTLIYAITISLVLYVLLGAFFAIKYHNSQTTIRFKNSFDLRNISESAFLYAHSSCGSLKEGATKKITVFEDFGDPVEVSKKRWGAFELLYIKSVLNNFEMNSVQLCGLNPKKFCSIYIPDENIYVTLQGNAEVKGKFSVPGGYFKREKFYGKVTTDSILSSSKSLPKVSDYFLGFIKNIKKFNFLKENYNLLEELPQSKTCSFSDTAFAYYSNESLMITDNNLEGKILIRSDKKVTLSPLCQLNDIIISAPIIEVKSGFSGSVQLFADSLITIGRNCDLKYPSVVSLVKGYDGTINIPYGTSVAGGIFLVTTSNKTNDASTLTLEEGSNLYGIAFCSKTTLLGASIYGSLYTNYVLPLSTNNDKNNVIKNATISGNELKSTFSYPAIFEGIALKEIETNYSGIRRIN